MIVTRNAVSPVLDDCIASIDVTSTQEKLRNYAPGTPGLDKWAELTSPPLLVTSNHFSYQSAPTLMSLIVRFLYREKRLNLPLIDASMKQYKIDSIEAMKGFFRDIIVEQNVALMPDDDFADYVKTGTDEPSFTQEEADHLNQVMTDCFQYCEENDFDIYEIAGEIQVEEYKKRGLLPENFGTE